MNPFRLGGTFLLLVALPGLAPAQMPKVEAIVMLKDGFYFRGIVVEQKDFFVDPASGQPIPIPKGFLYVDDHARRIHFDHSQVQEVIPLTAAELAGQMRLERYFFPKRRDVILPTWQFDDVTAWDAKWYRTVTVNTNFGSKYLKLDQRIGVMTPQYAQAMTVGYNWEPCFLTPEFGPDMGRRLAWRYFENKKEMKEPDKKLNLARFLQQTGWLEAAEKELTEYIDTEAGDKKDHEALLQIVKEQKVAALVDDLERRAQLGQYEFVNERLKIYDRDKLDEQASAKHRLKAQDLKTKYETLTTQLGLAKTLLKALSPRVEADNRAFWNKAVAALGEELTLDTLPRLESFIEFAQQYERDVKGNRKPSQSAEDVLALAVTGWLQGNQASEPDAKMARKLLEARTFLLEYLKKENVAARAAALNNFESKNMPVDVLARLVRLLPPPFPYEKIGTEPLKLTSEVPETEAVTYSVQLPPDYSHLRPHPVLILLHGARDDAEMQLKRWQLQASRHGFILAAPQWSQGGRAIYEHSPREHAVVLTTLRDLRRRFQVDSNRVFLFGWEDGATMAFDVGLSHPDQFAGVLPMCGSVLTYPARYWPNAQYLPFYVVEGDRNGGSPKMTRGLFKDWIRGHYPSVYLEYKGRPSEWFDAEVAQMMNWMSRKKRYHPLKQLGRHDTSGHPGSAEEFRTMRSSDNRFYWLSTDTISPRYLSDGKKWSNQAPHASLQASLHVGNELDVKKGANIWSQFILRTSGVKQVSLWIEEGLIDFTKPVQVRHFSEQIGPIRTITPSLAVLLQDLASNGDRQRLFVARVDMKFK
jgi:pimeloyl-ACP methyl ester carboxylesterase